MAKAKKTKEGDASSSAGEESARAGETNRRGDARPRLRPSEFDITSNWSARNSVLRVPSVRVHVSERRHAYRCDQWIPRRMCAVLIARRGIFGVPRSTGNFPAPQAPQAPENYPWI